MMSYRNSYYIHNDHILHPHNLALNTYIVRSKSIDIDDVAKAVHKTCKLVEKLGHATSPKKERKCTKKMGLRASVRLTLTIILV